MHNEFPKDLQRPMEDLIDAFLYLGPQDLRLKEKVAADFAVDITYRSELMRRESMYPGGAGGIFPGAPAATTLKELDQQILEDGENPILAIPTPPDPRPVVQDCLAHKRQGSPPQ